MASKWLRGITIDSSTSYWTSFWRKAYALWLYRVMEFSYISESCGGGRSWKSTEKDGTNGVFSGANFEFVDATATSFAQSDVGKFIVINDNTNYVNAGIYKIKKYVSTTKIIIDYQAGYNEYPLAATNLSWWIFGANYELPSAGDSIILQSRHTDNWEIKLVAYDPYSRLAVRIAPNGDWDKQIAVGSGEWDSGGLTSNSDNRTILTYWAEGDYDGDWLHMWMYNQQSNAPRGLVHLVSVEHVTPIDAGHSDDELLLLKVPTSTDLLESLGGRRYASTAGAGFVWSDVAGAVLTGYFIDYTLGWAGNNFLCTAPTPLGREINKRRDDKLEIYNGSYFVADVDNTAGNYQILGLANGHWSVPAIPYKGLYQSAPYAYDGLRHSMLPLTKDSAGDLLLLCEDIAVPWCNLSIRGCGI